MSNDGGRLTTMHSPAIEQSTTLGDGTTAAPLPVRIIQYARRRLCGYLFALTNNQSVTHGQPLAYSLKEDAQGPLRERAADMYIHILCILPMDKKCSDTA